MSEMTAKILEETLGKTVLVRLRGGRKLRGKVKGFDQHLNLLLEETEDITNAEKARKTWHHHIAGRQCYYHQSST